MKNEDIINCDEQGRMHGRQILMQEGRVIYDVGYNHGQAHGLWIDNWSKLIRKNRYYFNSSLEGEVVEYEH